MHQSSRSSRSSFLFGIAGEFRQHAFLPLSRKQRLTLLLLQFLSLFSSLTVLSLVVNCPSLHIPFPILRVRMWLGTVRLWKGERKEKDRSCIDQQTLAIETFLVPMRGSRNHCEIIVWAELTLFIVILKRNKKNIRSTTTTPLLQEVGWNGIGKREE